MSISLQNIYDLFFKKDLVKLSKPEPKTPPPSSRKPVLPAITPISKMIISTLSPQSQVKMLEELQADTLEIEAAEKKKEESDPDYQEKMANSGLGFYMENFVSWYGVCPVCKERTLRKYWHSNVPVIDFVCINKVYHLSTNTCFLFQLKISLSSEYFSFLRQTISVGSRKYGEIPHTVKGTSSIDYKRIVPGYICLRLVQKEIQVYSIDQNNSFILVPDYLNNSNLSYYEYLSTKDKYGREMITWNPSMFTYPQVDDILINRLVIYEVFEEAPIKNPYN